MATKVKTGVIDSSAITSALIANASITADDLHTTLDLTGKTVTVATASASDNDTSVASTAYVTTAIANLADSAPSTLNTLNELAAALGDDANYATTTTAAIATKLPLAGGTMTGALTATEVNIGAGATNGSKLRVNGKIVAGDVGSTAGDVLLEGYYGNGATVVIGSERSSGGVFLGYGVQPSVTTQGQFLSSTIATLSQGAYVVSDTHKWYTVTAGSSVAVGSQLTTMTERMRITGAGKVGIGNDAPSEALDISYAAHGLYSQHRPSASVGTGQEMYYDFNTADGTREHYSSIYTEIESSTDGAESGKIALRAAKAGVMTSGITLIGSTGNVGIGTTAPTFGKLEVNGPKYILTDSGQARGGVHVSPDSSATSGQYGGAISFSGGGSGSAAIASINDGGSDHDSVGLAFITHAQGTGSADAEEKMRITEVGNVGIGTDDPVAKLHVYNSAGGDATDKATMLSEAVMKLQPHTTNSTNMLFAQVDGGNSMGIQVTNGSATANWDLALSPFGGYVGIGTAAPNDILDIHDSHSQLRLTDVDDSKFVQFSYSGGKLITRNNSTSTTVNQITLTEDGKVGIRTISPEVALHVSGPLLISADNSAGISHSYTNMSAGNAGKLIYNLCAVGTMTTGDTIVFTYNALNWKSWFFKIRWSSTGGYMGERWAGGYNNNSDGYQVTNPKYGFGSAGQSSGDGATLTVTRSGQANTMTLTLDNNHVHPLFEIEYACGGGEGYPKASRASVSINS